MAHVKYDGPMDQRHLSAADWKVLGVEDGSKVTFEKGAPYDVSDEVAAVLLGDERLGGEFKEVSPDQLKKLIGEVSEDEGQPDSSAAQTGLDAAGEGNTTTTRSSRGRAKAT